VKFEEKFWLCLYLSVAQYLISFFRRFSLFHQVPACNPSSIPFIFLCPTSLSVKMSEKNQYFCLLFDEMLTRENVWFNQKFDCIEGFEDLGNQGITCNVTNHVLLFTVHVLHRM